MLSVERGNNYHGTNIMRLIYLHATGRGEKHEAYASIQLRIMGCRVARCARALDIRKIRLLYDRGVGSGHEFWHVSRGGLFHIQPHNALR